MSARRDGPHANADPAAGVGAGADAAAVAARGGIEVVGLRIARGAFAAGPFSFEVPSGAVTALVGPNGCGKSTLLETIAGLHPATDGRVSCDGAVWSEWGRAGGSGASVAPHERSIGFLPQRLGLWPHLTVREQALLVGGTASRVQELAESLDLSGLLDRRPAALSGGEAQRSALLRALAPAPRVLLLDEPTGQQFPTLADRVRAVVDEEAADGAIVLVATHQPWPGAMACPIFEVPEESTGG